MRVFLTGGTGFIGRRVAERLRARGYEVVALVRSPSEPNLAERIRISDGMKIRMIDAKARSELGYAPRPLREGLLQTLAG